MAWSGLGEIVLVYLKKQSSRFGVHWQVQGSESIQLLWKWFRWHTQHIHSSPSGTVIKRTWINLLNKLTNSTLPSNSWLKYQRTRLLSLTQWCSKEQDSKMDPFWTSTHHKPTETFQYTHFNSCHPPGVKNGFIKGEAIRLLRTKSSKTTFEESLMKFKKCSRTRGYPKKS